MLSTFWDWIDSLPRWVDLLFVGWVLVSLPSCWLLGKIIHFGNPLDDEAE